MNKDIKSQKFNRLTVIEYVGLDKNFKRLWKCKCDCGREIVVDTSSLTTGNTKSCGCYKNEMIKTLNLKHGKSHIKLYYVWQEMKKRCLNPKSKSYKNYGKRGITVCNEWADNFETFAKWAIRNGYKEGLSIDRVNNNGNYEPNNCRWVTSKIQTRNTRRNRYIILKNEKILITDACNIIHKPISTVYSRAKRKNISFQDSFNYYLQKGA